MKFNYRSYLPHAAAIVIFAIATLIYFKPLLSGKELRQDDIARHKGMSKEIADYREKHHSEPLWTNSMFGGMPAYQISTLYPGNFISKLDPAFKLFLPHPGGYMFLYCLGFFILLLCLNVNPWLSLIGGLAYGLSSYFLIIIEAGHNSKANALGYLPALIGGVILLFRGRYWIGLSVAALFSAMEINANHVQITYYGYMIVAAIIIGYFVESVRTKQISSFFKAFALFLVASIAGLLPNAGNLMTTNEYGKYSTRGKSDLTIKANLKKDIGLDEQKGSENQSLANEPAKEKYEKNVTTGLDIDYATQWSYGIGETFTFLIPDFKGGASGTIRNSDPSSLKKVNPDFREQVANNNSYFGDQYFTSGPVYIGAIIVLLAILGMFLVKNSIKWPLFCVTLLTVMLGWGHHFLPLTEFFMHYVPGYNKFRAVSMIMVVAELTLPLMAMLAINEFLKTKDWNQKVRLQLLKKDITLKKLVIICTSVVGGFCALCYIAPDLFNSFTAEGEERQMLNSAVRGGNPEDQARTYIAELIPQLELARKAIFKSDAMRSLIFIVLAFGAIYLYFTNKIKQELLLASIGLFIVIDLWTVDTRYLNARSFITKEENRQNIVAKTAADEEILQDPDPDYRVLNLSESRWQDATTSYYHKSIGGYHGAKLKKYQELIDFQLDKEVDLFYKKANKAFGSDSATNTLLGELEVLNMLNTKYIILPGGENREELPLKNPMANGHAWFIKTLFVAPTADDEILGLRKLKTKTQAMTTEKYKNILPLKETYSGAGEIKLLSYEPNKLQYESNSTADGFAVFSEIYYSEGWNAYVDGSLKPHIRVNYVLRGMNVPAGKHKIEFRFEPNTYTTGNSIAMLGSVLLLLTVGAGLYLHRKNNVIVS